MLRLTDVPIRHGVMYAPHPAFAKDAQGKPLYLNLTREQLGDKRSPWDFAVQGTRELVADDFVYAISDSGMRVANIANLAAPLATADFTRTLP